MKPKNCCYICGSKDSQVLFTFKGKDKYLDSVFEITPKDDMNWRYAMTVALFIDLRFLNKMSMKGFMKIMILIFLKILLQMSILIRLYHCQLELKNREKASWLKAILDENDLNDNLKILDIGCGGEPFCIFSMKNFQLMGYTE